MKRLLSPVLLTLLLLAGTDIAAAATRAAGISAMKIVFDTGGGSIFVSSASGLGFAGKGPPKTSGAVSPAPTPVDIEFNVAPQSEGMSRVLAYLAGKGTSMDASVKLLDFNYAVKQQINLGSSSIVELELPGGKAQDGKQAAQFRMRLQPRQFSAQAGTGTLAPDTASKTKSISLSNFRVSLNDVAEPTISEVSPCVVRRVGKNLQISGLGVTLPQAQALSGEWQKWSEIALAGGEQTEKSLRIEYLDATLATVLLTIDFTGVGIQSMEMPELETSADTVARVTFGMYARGVSIK